MAPSTPVSEERRPASHRRTYRRVGREVRQFRGKLIGLFFLSALGSALVLLVPVPLKIAVDSVLGSEPPPGFLEALLPASFTASSSALLVTAAGMFVTVAVLVQLQQTGLVLLSTYTGQKLLLGFRSKLFRHVQRLSLGYHDSRGTIDSSYRIQWDAPALQHIAVDGTIPLVTAAMTVVGMGTVTALIDWQLALVALTVSPVLIVMMRVYGDRLRTQWHEAKALESSAFSVVHEVLGALRVVKAFGREEYEKARFVDRSSESVRAQIRLSFTESLLSMAVGMTIALGTAVVLYLGVRRVQAGALTLGELLLVVTYLTQLYEPLRDIAKKIGDLQASVAGAERVFAVLDHEPDLVDPPHGVAIDRARGELELQEVSFGYERGRPVLRDVSMSVPPGTNVGIAGTTGAGKTTLISLLTRFYDPTSGRILLDGVDLRDYKLADLRNQFAIVLQEPVLFPTSIAENIAYARSEASHDEIAVAARAANADGFITALPDGYETLVGERGMRLSGGERQRIALARAFLKDAPVLILDEPTSSVDVQTERVIMEAMERLMSGRTTFMIAHRLTTLESCDVRLEIGDGRVQPVASTASRDDSSETAAVAPSGRGAGRNGAIREHNQGRGLLARVLGRRASKRRGS